MDPEAGELRKQGALIRLQEQPFRLLCVLVEFPGQVISRDELRGRIWPADTFVDFDSSLNMAVLKVRQALGDSASHPRFIETIPRRGYRFVAPVVSAHPAREGAASVGPGNSLGVEPAVDVSAVGHISNTRRFGYWLAGTLLTGSLGLSAFYLIPRQPTPGPTTLTALPLTVFPGTEVNPALSPDGKQGGFCLGW
jgi:DNA-binding winged helix-turn-helix (wHTH) protein